jgi:uncharacterized protein (TIGR02594 family)
MADADEPQPDDPSWLKFAFQELALHVVEKPGKKTNERIERYLQSTRGSPGREQDETLWCSAFVNFCIEESTGLEGTNNLAARSWLNWEKGKEATRPTRGCIVVFSRPSAGEHSGHVGFYLSGSAETGIRILGGNQSDAVSIVTQPLPFLGYRVPIEELSIVDAETRKFFENKFKQVGEHADDLFRLADHGAETPGHNNHHQNIRDEITRLRTEMEKKFKDLNDKLDRIAGNPARPG